MGLKFGRNYSLSVLPPGESSPIIINPPLTLEFEITRNDLSSANHGHFRIYNLSEKKRNRIHRSPNNVDAIFEVKLNAGYGELNLPVCFRGQIFEAWSVREGVNFITEMDCFDGGRAYTEAQINMQFTASVDSPVPIRTVIDQIVDNIVAQTPGLTKGFIGSFQGNITRGNSYVGSGMEVLKRLTGGGVFIDNGTINCLVSDADVLPVQVLPVINAASGLIGTPRLEFPKVIATTLFSPNLSVGQNVILETESPTFDPRAVFSPALNQKSSTPTLSQQSTFRQAYKILGINHRGIISPAVSGEALTILSLYSGQFLQGVPSV